MVFKSKRDRKKFLEYLGSATRRYDALIHAYCCLMDKHYQVMLETLKNEDLCLMAKENLEGIAITYASCIDEMAHVV